MWDSGGEQPRGQLPVCSRVWRRRLSPNVLGLRPPPTPPAGGSIHTQNRVWFMSMASEQSPLHRKYRHGKMGFQLAILIFKSEINVVIMCLVKVKQKRDEKGITRWSFHIFFFECRFLFIFEASFAFQFHLKHEKNHREKADVHHYWMKPGRVQHQNDATYEWNWKDMLARK